MTCKDWCGTQVVPNGYYEVSEMHWANGLWWCAATCAGLQRRLDRYTGPAIQSGTDAGAAKPTRVEVGQRWRTNYGLGGEREYRVQFAKPFEPHPRPRNARCSLGAACTHHNPRKPEPYVPSIDEYDLLPDA